MRCLASLFIFSSFLFITDCNFNFYISSNEVRRLLGSKSEMFYVRNGTVNRNALNFSLLIPADVNDVVFTWNHRKNSRDFSKLLYTLSFHHLDPPSINIPTSSISHKGAIPNHKSVFRVSFHCTGLYTTEHATMFLYINSSSSASSSAAAAAHHSSYIPISLQISLIKHCHKMLHSQDALASSGMWKSDFEAPFHSGSENVGSGFYTAVGLVFGIIIITSIFLSTCYLQRSRHHHNCKKSNSFVELLRQHEENSCRHSDFLSCQHKSIQQVSNYTDVSHVTKNPQKPPHVHPLSSLPCPHKSPPHTHTPNKHSNHHTPPSHHHHHLPKPLSLTSVAIAPLDLLCADARSSLQDVQIEASSVAFDSLVADGTYGRVFVGHLVGSCEVLRRKSVNKKVLIKTLTGDASKESTEQFLKQGCLTKDLSSPHVLSVEAAVVHAGARPMLIYPSADHDDAKGDDDDDDDYDDDVRCSDVLDMHIFTGELKFVNLKVFVTSLKEEGGRGGVTADMCLSPAQLLLIGRQVSQGMHYLHKKHLVHCDLACRNCVINDHMLVKVTDSALSCDLFSEDYDRLECSELRPIRWLAPEALKDKMYSPSSDVWSFGVLLWELMTSCERPYDQVATAAKLLRVLLAGFRLCKPPSCPQPLFSVVACCWSLEAADRPSFSQLSLSLHSMLQESHGGR